MIICGATKNFVSYTILWFDSKIFHGFEIFVNFLSQYKIIEIMWFWGQVNAQFQVCDDLAGNNLDFGVSIFGQSHVMQGIKSDFNMVAAKVAELMTF